ncbi:hypothetical protein EZJ43_11030 [Pedobacter changchengzhani]|uniref:Calcineurin-like phosphoesterase domain-containing protein n=1 Tax=Pedobacter changchengzhani TaxID=2529274 RepID=A0A4R5MK20_9SPHI|nr:BamA/TamA family outer membrane protein [Pedobacter changchengzhani]TDG35882.1 hypothetical protein EZJ43_11030 [Pedobacter changchengzhani]
MLKKITFIVAFILTHIVVSAQTDSIKYRVILIGDAGEMNTLQMQDLKNAAQQVIPNKTAVFFLGDNIYPTGMGLSGTASEAEGQKILQSQFQPMRAMGASVYFIPGNHDWDKSGPDGLAKIKAQGDYLRAQNDPLLKMIPEDGCPDPVAIKLTDKLTVVAYDSEWWLFPYNKNNPIADCDCHTKDEIVVKMKDLLDQNLGKTILVASHHPMQSYGSHGGYFTWKNHLFPLLSLKDNLYIPLPGIGSLYPLLRSSLLSPEDLNHPAYKDLIKSVNSVFGAYPNAAFVSGHEHGLQLIQSKQLQIVSGSGSKASPNKFGKNTLFHEEKQGYVIADQLLNNDMRYTYYIYADSGAKKVYTYIKPFVKLTQKDITPIKPIIGDSITIKINTAYDSVGKFHRFLFGENYRKDYALATKVPVLRMSQFKGGLTATKLGGGNQSKSLRLVDKDGKEWVLRSVLKYPEVLLPAQLRETFAKDIIRDNVSAQHPFSALVVPELAKAAGVPHSNPIIGYVSADPGLGDFSSVFANTLCLLEEREPTGESDNTAKMMKKLVDDNDNTYDGPLQVKARALDVLIGDWDRHDDQWRWKEEKTDKGSKYSAVPRDRDQVFYRSQGLVQRFAQSSTLLPMMQGYERNVEDINWFLWEGREINTKYFSEIDEKQWDSIVAEFCASITDEVMEKALLKLPTVQYALRHDQFLDQMKKRRATLPKMMNDYYHFFNKIVDVEMSDKNESIHINDTQDGGLAIKINKISKEGELKKVIYKRIFDPLVTKEIRVYMHNGNDSLILNNKTSNIKLRIIGGKGKKVYNVANAENRVIVYAKGYKAQFNGDAVNKLSTRLSNDTANVGYAPKDIYKRSSLNLNAGFNTDDGLLAGLTYRITNPGFRKHPYGNSQTVSFLHSFATTAFKFHYTGEWLKALGKGDLIVKADAYAPDNTQNFFGYGNESKFDEHGDDITYYRARFNIYQITPLIRYRRPKSSFSFGPTFQYYKFDKSDNFGRFINNSNELHSYDSLTITNDKIFAGAVVNFSNNTRDNDLLPTLGSFVNFKLILNKGLNKYANDYAQLNADIAIYKNLDGRANLILADRFGGGITIGKPAFYQAQFLGGQGNLLGFRQFRFAGQNSFYNNLELRYKLGDFVSYVLPGQVGLLGFYDVGRVWASNEQSDRWHQGIGGGVYFAPASLAVLQFVMGHSSDGWYPYVSIGFRF